MKIKTHPNKKRSQAFSLIELLVVLAILGLLLAITSIPARSPQPAHAANLVTGMIQAARAEAITAGARSRVAICVDANATERYLRQVVVLIDSDSDTTTDEWSISSIEPLPTGTCFRREYSTVSRLMKVSSEELTVQSGSEGHDYTYIEFDALGRCESSSQWVFSQAEFEAGEPRYFNELNRDGFILRKTGKLAQFHSPEQIIPPLNNE